MENNNSDFVLNATINGANVQFTQQNISDMFHLMYYNSRVWSQTYWMGSVLLKCPLDLWIYQEILFEIMPDLIIETGTFQGGSALYFAHICDLFQKGKIISIDINRFRKLPQHPRIEYITDSSVSPAVIETLKAQITEKTKTLVILDSDHSKQHVLKELAAYSELVSVNSYLIVEDSNINGHPVRQDLGEGPFEAIDEFLKTTDKFIIDKSREKFFMTQNPNGYLKRTK